MGASFGGSVIRGVWVACVLLLVPVGAAAQAPSSDELARRHFDSGAAYLQESDYENALKAFEKAYELSKRPAILINIATVEERRGNLDGAIAALKKYLELEPAGEHVETTKLRLQNLEKRASEQAPAPPPPAPVAAPPPPPPAPAPKQAPAPAPTQADSSSIDRTPAYIAFGIGGVAALGAVATGIMANSEYQSAEEECSPACSDSELSSGRTLATVSTIATGVAVVGAGFGLVLWLSAPSSDTAQNRAHVRVGVGRSGPRAEYSFAF